MTQRPVVTTHQFVVNVVHSHVNDATACCVGLPTALSASNSGNYFR